MGPRGFARAAQILTDSSAEEGGETQRKRLLCESLRISAPLRWFNLTPAVDLTAKNAKITKKDSYCQEREIHDPEQPLIPALSPSEGEREKPRQLRV